jgi:hypothetical protein
MALAFVKEGGFTSNKVTIANTYSITVPAGGHAAGNLLVVVTTSDASGNGMTISQVTDSRGNTYAISDPGANPASGCSTGVAASLLTTALQAGDTITILQANSGTGNSSKWAVVSAEFSGATTTEDVASAAASIGTVTNDSNPTVGPITPPSAQTLIIGALGFFSNVGTAVTEDTDNAGGDTWHTLTMQGTTGGSGPTNIAARISYKFTTSSAAQTFNPVLSIGRQWGVTIVALQQAVVSSLRRQPSLVPQVAAFRAANR